MAEKQEGKWGEKEPDGEGRCPIEEHQGMEGDEWEQRTMIQITTTKPITLYANLKS